MAFVPSTDLDRSRTFFESVLGLNVDEVTPYACVARSGTTTLRITLAEEWTPQQFTVLGWQVTDIERQVADLQSRGVQFERFGFFEQDALGIWTAPGGDKVAWFKDPDGNVLSVSQHA